MSVIVPSATTPSGAVRIRGFASRNANELGLLAAIVVMCVVLGLLAPNFATINNFTNIARDAAFVGIIAWGMTLVIVAGEIDISPGAVMAFSSVALAEMVTGFGLPILAAILIVLVFGTAVGAGVGALRAFLNVPTFIGSLALWSGLRGLANLWTDGLPVAIQDPVFRWFGSGNVLGVPVPTLAMLVLFVSFLFISKRTRFGRSAYAIGGNAKAALLTGVPVRRIRVGVLATTGMLSTLAGIILAARLGSGNASAATGMEFDVIAAVVVGGTSLLGGRGTIVGTLLGAMFIAILTNGLVLMGVNPFAQDVVRGAIILVAVVVNVAWTRKDA